MKLLYPKKYRENSPRSTDVEFVENIDLEYGQNLSGFFDTVVMIVNHSPNCAALNYNSWIESRSNVIYVTTFIDCNYLSSNLEFLINKFKKWEDIWNG